MEHITKQRLLDKTHYGINVFSFILRKYYPNEIVLKLSHRVCELTKNPFNHDKKTLRVSIIDNCAVFKDSENAMPSGDVFDFAGLHYKGKSNELFETIAKDMRLFPENSRNEIVMDENIDDPKPNKAEKIVIPSFSYFKKPILNTIPSQTINLLHAYKYITHSNFRKATETLRNVENPKEARKFKASNFDYVTFSGIFSKRNDKSLKKHSGLLTIDLDNLENVSEIRQSLYSDKYFEPELIFISPSGNGLKWIIKIDLTIDSHENYFKAVSNYVEATYNIKVDNSGKDVSRACFLPYDPEAVINPKYLRKL